VLLKKAREGAGDMKRQETETSERTDPLLASIRVNQL
jgi:hypothetical protein